MNDQSQIGRPAARRSEALRARAKAYTILAQCFSARRGTKDFWGPGGRRNPLKRLNSAKEIQGKPRLFLGLPLGLLGPAWPSLAKFGLGLDDRIVQFAGRRRRDRRWPCQLSTLGLAPHPYGLAPRPHGAGPAAPPAPQL
jgi:hypothetical protein